ncbi:hypothetical protein ACIRD3_21175 [Kitasatospora sp. NPDC093550]|uniref:hypothetical protein n=1 Tax=Kitasatospora sp. NPDC093550 TaxID=3364089 RepID=UPI0038214EE4
MSGSNVLIEGERATVDGIPPERVVTDSWPALHGRPVLRRTVAVGLVLFVSVAAALVVRGVNALTIGGPGHETDRDRAERLAGLHPSQHPGVGRYYVPVGAVYTHTSDGAPVAYLHYRLGGGKAPGVGDFLSAYDLPDPGPAAPLPADLVAALGGDEPAEAPELREGPFGAPSAVPTTAVPTTAVPTTAMPTGSVPTTPAPLPSAAATASPTASASPRACASPTEEGRAPAPAADPDADADADEDAAPALGPGPGPGPGVVPAPAVVEEPPVPTPAPTLTPTATPVPTPAPSARRFYVATIPGGLPGAADIYIRATG